MLLFAALLLLCNVLTRVNEPSVAVFRRAGINYQGVKAIFTSMPKKQTYVFLVIWLQFVATFLPQIHATNRALRFNGKNTLIDLK